MNLVQALRVHEKFCPQQHDELPHVHLRHQDLTVALQDFAEIPRQRIQVTQVDMPDARALGPLGLERGGDRAVRRAPGDNQQIAGGIPFRHDVGDIVRDRFHFRGARADHVLMIQRVVIHVAGHVLLLNAADAVLEAWRAGNGPGACQRVRIAAVRQKSHRVGLEVDRDLRQL